MGHSAGGFIAGADVSEFGQVRAPDEAVPSIRAAHAVLQRLEDLRWTFGGLSAIRDRGSLESALARLQYESDRAVTLLGWRPRVGVREGIKRSV